MLIQFPRRARVLRSLALLDRDLERNLEAVRIACVFVLVSIKDLFVAMFYGFVGKIFRQYALARNLAPT